jgi:SAM-dependent methyltransferase
MKIKFHVKQITIKNCPICGSNSITTAKIQTTDYSVSKESFNISECQECGLLFTNPRPVAEDLGRYYKSSNYISHTNQASGLFGKTYQVLRNWSIKRKFKLLDEHVVKGSLLDYGCGTGEFLAEGKKLGWRVIGMEIAEDVRKRAISTHQLEVISPGLLHNLDPASFDVITMWHVLEHVSELQIVAHQLVEKIKPGGYLVLAVPNPDSWDAKYYKEYWAALDVPIHLYHFKKHNIVDLFAKFEMQSVSVVNMPLDAFYVSLLSEEYKTGRKKWMKAFFVGLISNIKTFNRTNSSSLTYILQKTKA